MKISDNINKLCRIREGCSIQAFASYEGAISFIDFLFGGTQITHKFEGLLDRPEEIFLLLSVVEGKHYSIIKFLYLDKIFWGVTAEGEIYPVKF